MKKYIISVWDALRSIFLNGLLTILPITLTFALFRFSFNLVKGWLQPIYRLEPNIFKVVPQSEIILVILFVLIVGIILKFFLLHPIIHFIESIFNQIPLVRQVYFGIKQIVHAFTSQDKLSFQKVVFIEFPRSGIYSVGFLTSAMPSNAAPTANIKYFNVFIPTTPNPTTGYFICVPENEIVPVDLTRQEAMALIISGGIILPHRYIYKH